MLLSNQINSGKTIADATLMRKALLNPSVFSMRETGIESVHALGFREKCTFLRIISPMDTGIGDTRQIARSPNTDQSSEKNMTGETRYMHIHAYKSSSLSTPTQKEDQSHIIVFFISSVLSRHSQSAEEGSSVC